ncbi:ABC transporter substrate-binding protein [Leifsonia poae]|uniref:Glycine/betaine ABC transporter permease n=1 Tax=Leifsonia poae TaxID=110933 RepID=A0A9W6HCH4_9MICO|nr:glycine/betaine ABC transporter permease [Leifsonia poae]
MIAAGALLALSACSSGGGALSGDTASSAPDTITVGSAAFPENEILMQIYAQALESKGVKVTTKPNIGQRDVYLAALKDGSIDLVPEYSGNLLQYYSKDSTATSSDDVFAALNDALPSGFEVLDQSQAQDADSYNVTKEFSDKYGVTSLADLSKVTIPLVVGANPEFATRPYGIPGLKSAYGVTATLKKISDSGGPLTVAALKNGDVQLADIYTTTPAIKENNFVTLKDPKSLIAAQNVVPLINSKKASNTVKDVLNQVSKALTTEDLITLNSENQGASKTQPDALAKEWLASHPIK